MLKRSVRRVVGSAAALSLALFFACGGDSDKPPVKDFGAQQQDSGSLADATDATKPDSTVNGACATAFSYSVIDAEYSKALDNVVVVSASPNVLHIIDPRTAAERTVALPATPTSVSVGPDGVHAAVGHDGSVSYIDLSAGTVLATHPVDCAVLDVVLAGNGYAYVFPLHDQWESIRSVRISNGEVTHSGGASIYAGTLARLHPSGKYMYGADNGVSPSDIFKMSLGTGTPTDAGAPDGSSDAATDAATDAAAQEDHTAEVLYDSPYHGDHPMSGNLWFSDDGALIFTRGATVLASSENKADDMIYRGSLSLGSIRSADTYKGRIFAVSVVSEFTTGSTLEDSFVQEFATSNLGYVTKSKLPCYPVAGSVWSHGRYVFVRSDGSDVYAVVQAVKYECLKTEGNCTVDEITRTPIDRWGITVAAH